MTAEAISFSERVTREAVSRDAGGVIFVRAMRVLPPFPFCISANICIRKETFARAGGFSLDYPLASGEDMELGYKVSRAGGRLAYAPDAIVRHHHRTSFKDLYNQFVRYGKGSAQFYFLNSQHFSRRKVETETDGQWSCKEDIAAWLKIIPRWLLRAKSPQGNLRWQEMLFDHCTRKGWAMGKREWRRENADIIRTPKVYDDPKLIIHLTPCCWREYYVPIIPLGQMLEQRGYQVRFLYGNAGHCTFLGTLEDWDAKKCQRQFVYLSEELKKARLLIR